jgi:EmrB/QacA subfamily drug resistance transporter
VTPLRWTVVLAGVGSLMAALDTLVVSTALPAIRVDLGASVAALEWSVNAYNLSFAVLLITGAALGDRFGRRGMYAAGLGLFALASAACALAPDPGTLIAARTLQGAGAALVMPLALALVTGAFPPEKRGAAIGMFSAITGIAVACGPLVGGAVVQGLAWQWVFWVNVPIGIVAAGLVLRRLPETFGPRVRVDLRGLLLVTLGTFGIVWGLVRSDAAGWASVEVIGAIAAGLVLGVAFVGWERRAAAPMLPLRLFSSRAFRAGNAAIFCTFAALFASVFFYAQYLQTALGYDPFATGLRLLPWTATFVTVAPLTGALTDRVGERPLLFAGLTLQGAGMAWMALIADTSTTYGQLLGPFLVGGIGVSMAIPSAQNSVMGAVGDDVLGVAAGANSMMRELGGVFGIAVVVAVFAGAGGFESPAAFVAGFGPAMGVGAGLAAVGALATLTLPAHEPVRQLAAA